MARQLRQTRGKKGLRKTRKQGKRKGGKTRKRVMGKRRKRTMRKVRRGGTNAADGFAYVQQDRNPMNKFLFHKEHFNNDDEKEIAEAIGKGELNPKEYVDNTGNAKELYDIYERLARKMEESDPTRYSQKEVNKLLGIKNEAFRKKIEEFEYHDSEEKKRLVDDGRIGDILKEVFEDQKYNLYEIVERNGEKALELTEERNREGAVVTNKYNMKQSENNFETPVRPRKRARVPKNARSTENSHTPNRVRMG